MQGRERPFLGIKNLAQKARKFFFENLAVNYGILGIFRLFHVHLHETKKTSSTETETINYLICLWLFFFYYCFSYATFLCIHEKKSWARERSKQLWGYFRLLNYLPSMMQKFIIKKIWKRNLFLHFWYNYVLTIHMNEIND